MRYLPVILILFTSCSLFETREPEPPGLGQGSIFIQPDRPEAVIENLQNAVANLNLQNYVQSLDDSRFMFTPTNSAQINDPTIWANWSVLEEQLYFNNLRAAAEGLTGHQLQFTNINSESQSVTVQQFRANYTLTVVHNRTSADIPTVAQGEIILLIEAGENGLWNIVSWTDISSGGTFSWSDFKAAFVRG